MYTQICSCTGEGPNQKCKLHGWIPLPQQRPITLPVQSIGQSCAPTMVNTICSSCASKGREINQMGAYMTYLVAHSGCQCKYCLPAAQIANRFTNAALSQATYQSRSMMDDIPTTMKAQPLWK